MTGRVGTATVRQGVEIGLGLALIGVQRWMSLRGDVEAELDRLGFGHAADLSRQIGDAVTEALSKLAATPTTRS